MTPCSMPGCDRQVFGHDLCSKHYQRQRRLGNPAAEVRAMSVTKPGAATEYLTGVVLPFKGQECLTWPFSKDEYGRGQIRIDQKLHRVARLVCQSIHGPAPTPTHHAAHSCGKGHLACVNPNHLSWKTPIENAADKIRHGTHGTGGRGSGAKLSSAKAIEIYLSDKGLSHNHLAAIFGVTARTIRAIRNKTAWTAATQSIEIGD